MEPATKANLSGRKITNIPGDVKEAFLVLTQALAKLTDKTDQMYCTGGFVRDLVLGLPFHDIDITLQEVYFDQFIKIVRELPGVTGYAADFTAGEEFKGEQVELIRFELKGISFDLKRATFDHDMEGDIMKRDFTVNALYINPFTWEIFDPKGYLADVYSRTLRGVNNYSIIFIDRNRIIRTVRFHWKGFEYEPGLEKYLESGAKAYMRDAKDPSDLQRLGGELRKCFNSSKYHEILTELISKDLLRFLCINKQIMLKSVEVIKLAKDLLHSKQWAAISEHYLNPEAREADEIRLIIHLYLSYFLRLSAMKIVPRSSVKRIGMSFLRLSSLTEIVKNYKRMVRISESTDLPQIQSALTKYIQECQAKDKAHKSAQKHQNSVDSKESQPTIIYSQDDLAFKLIDAMQLGLLLPIEVFSQLKFA